VDLPTLDTQGLSQAEGDLSIVPDLGDARPDLPSTDATTIQNTAALEMNTQAILASGAKTSDISTSGVSGSSDIPGVSGLSFSNPLNPAITEGLTGKKPAEDAAFAKGLPTTLEGVTPALTNFKSNLEATKDPFLSFGSSLLNVFSGSGSSGSSGGLGGLFSSLLGGLFGGGGKTTPVSTPTSFNVPNSILSPPSLADGNIREALNMPRTPGGKDPRERGADSRLAVLNAQELVVPAGLAQDFLAFKSNQDISNSLTNNNNSTSNSTSNNTTNNSYQIQPDSFGRSNSAQTIISDPTANTRKRFNTAR
jgi:hypothetical protein